MGGEGKGRSWWLWKQAGSRSLLDLKFLPRWAGFVFVQTISTGLIFAVREDHRCKDHHFRKWLSHCGCDCRCARSHVKFKALFQLQTWMPTEGKPAEQATPEWARSVLCWQGSTRRQDRMCSDSACVVTNVSNLVFVTGLKTKTEHK